MANKSSIVLVSAVLMALIIGGAIGYVARAGEVSALMSSNTMMHNEMQMSGSAISLMPASGSMPPHDVWFIITPLQGGKYVVGLHAAGLETNGSYLVEGVTKGAQMNTVPIATTATDSEFVPDNHGNGVYWHVFDIDPRTQFESVELLYLPNMQMQGAMQVASGTLS
jgi:hypothetical protein